ncbi:hypothetical protein CsSME_00007615 [Camellia sinensis var. sinensis]
MNCLQKPKFSSPLLLQNGMLISMLKWMMMVIEFAMALQEAGCFFVVLECVLALVAAAATFALRFLTIGIGTQMKELGAQSSATDEEIFKQVLGLDRPGRVRTNGLGPSLTNVFGGGFRQLQEQAHLIQTQVQEQLNQHKVQMEMQVKEMMDAMFSQMQGSNIRGRRRSR